MFSSVQPLSRAWIFVDPMDCSMPGLPVHHQGLEFTQTHVHWLGDAIQPLHPLSSPSPPAFNLSQHQGLFQWVSSLNQVAKVFEFQLQQQLSNDYSGLIFFKIEWFDLLAVQGTLKCLLQHHSSKASVLPERIQIKISQRKKYRRQDIVGLQMWVFCCPFSVESGYLILGYQHVKM